MFKVTSSALGCKPSCMPPAFSAKAPSQLLYASTLYVFGLIMGARALCCPCTVPLRPNLNLPSLFALDTKVLGSTLTANGVTKLCMRFGSHNTDTPVRWSWSGLAMDSVKMPSQCPHAVPDFYLYIEPYSKLFTLLLTLLRTSLSSLPALFLPCYSHPLLGSSKQA